MERIPEFDELIAWHKQKEQEKLNKGNKMKVYLVKQHQTESEYDNYIVDVFDTEEKAQAKCREYNKEYAHNVKLNKFGDWTGEILNDYVHHYYDYFTMVVE